MKFERQAVELGKKAVPRGLRARQDCQAPAGNLVDISYTPLLKNAFGSVSSYVSASFLWLARKLRGQGDTTAVRRKELDVVCWRGAT